MPGTQLTFNTSANTSGYTSNPWWAHFPMPTQTLTYLEAKSSEMSHLANVITIQYVHTHVHPHHYMKSQDHSKILLQLSSSVRKVIITSLEWLRTLTSWGTKSHSFGIPDSTTDLNSVPIFCAKIKSPFHLCWSWDPVSVDNTKLPVPCQTLSAGHHSVTGNSRLSLIDCLRSGINFTFLGA